MDSKLPVGTLASEFDFGLDRLLLVIAPTFRARRTSLDCIEYSRPLCLSILWRLFLTSGLPDLRQSGRFERLVCWDYPLPLQARLLGQF